MSGLQAFLIDMSLGGLRVAHRDPAMDPGTTGLIEFSGPTAAIQLEYLVLWSLLYRGPKQPGGRSVFHTGVTILAADEHSGVAMREMIQHHIELALDEQKSNARGIPPIAVRTFRTGGGTDFVRLEVDAGVWQRSKTKDPKQPSNGFTISADEPEPQIQLLCSAYIRSNAEGRDLIRAMAELSISKPEGVPTRRFTP
jgi:hypothetical protein